MSIIAISYLFSISYVGLKLGKELGLDFSFGPTTQHPHRTIRIVGDVDILELDQPARLDTRPHQGEANVSPSHIAVFPFDVRHAYSHPASVSVA